MEDGNRELSEIELQEYLTDVGNHKGDLLDIHKVVKIMAKLIFNLRYDLVELKIDLVRIVGNLKEEIDTLKESSKYDKRDYGGMYK